MLTERIKVSVKKSVDGRVDTAKLYGQKSQPVRMPANSGAILYGTIPSFLNGTPVLVESTDEISLPSGIVVCPTVSEVSEGKIAIQVRNYDSCDRFWRHKQQIAKLCLCDVVHRDFKFIF